MSSSPYSQEQLTLCANTIRMLSADAIDRANSGHPGMPMGMAELGTMLWLKYIKFYPSDPRWFVRDRFVLSNGHGSMLLYSLLHLSGFELSLDDLKAFRQWESKTPGHPEFGLTPGVECTTGPLGQGISNAVGMAIGQKLLAARYGENATDENITALFQHRVFCFAGDGCLMEGISSEASSLAGHLGLGNLIVIYDDNQISIAGRTTLAFTEDVGKRYESYGWHVLHIDGHDFTQIDQGFSEAIKISDRPTLIAARTIIGKGSPNKADDSEVHGSPLGKSELELTKRALNWPVDKSFYVPEDVKRMWASRLEELERQYAAWKTDFRIWSEGNKDKAQRLQTQLSRQVPCDLEDRLIAAIPTQDAPVSTRKLSQTILQAASASVDSLIGGSADLEPSTLTLINKSSDIAKGSFNGLNLRFGVREHAMGAIMNGLSYYGAFLPYGSTFLCFADYLRPTLRLAAISHLPGLFIFTHDSVFLGEDGPTHQPVEHINSLRMIPNLFVFRPADGLETAVCYRIALERRDGPSAIVLTRQNLPVVKRTSTFDRQEIAKGAYLLYENQPTTGLPGQQTIIVMIATGSELSLAYEAALLLGDRATVRVVSMPCWELFAKQPEDWKKNLIPKSAKLVVLEAGISFGWLEMLQASFDNTLFISIERYGASAPYQVIAEKLGFTPQSVAQRVRERFLSEV